MQLLHNSIGETNAPATPSHLHFLRHKMTDAARDGFAKEMWVLPLDIGTHVIAGGGVTADTVMLCSGVAQVESLAEEEISSSGRAKLAAAAAAAKETKRGGIVVFVPASSSTAPLVVNPSAVAALKREFGAAAIASDATHAAIVSGEDADETTAPPALALPLVLRCNAAAFGRVISSGSNNSDSLPFLVMPLNYGHVSKTMLPACVIALKRNTNIKIVADLSQKLTATSTTLKGDAYTAQAPLYCCPAVTCKTVAAASGKTAVGGAAIVTCDISSHVDSPAHFIAGGRTISDLTAVELRCPAVVLDCSARVPKLDQSGQPRAAADIEITVDDIQQWETKHGRPIPDGALVCCRSGWSAYFQQPELYRNCQQSAGGAMSFPGFSAEAATFLVKERRIAGLGVDTLSVDVGSSTTFPVHHTILGASLYNVENCDFTNLPPAGCEVIVAPMCVRDAPEAPARVVAIEVLGEE